MSEHLCTHIFEKVKEEKSSIINEHLCTHIFETTKIDHCSGQGCNRCYGTSPMILEIWFEGQNGLEEYVDDCTVTEVNFCPFCGLKSLGSE